MMTCDDRRRELARAHNRAVSEMHDAEDAHRKAQSRLRTARDNLAKATESLLQAVREESTDV
jgi:hypothetical protein